MANDQVPALVEEAKFTEPGQRAVTVPFLMRQVPSWSIPDVLPADKWRLLVRYQPIAMICRQTIIDTVVSAPWRVASKSPVNDYQYDIDKYTDLIDTGDGGYDVHSELILQDTLDIPFGGASELGRSGDRPDGELLWFQRIDGATLIPSYALDYPVLQWGYTVKPIYFPKHAVNRVYYSPRPELMRKGWGMAPPERIYLAFEMLARGDRYYANLLLDTPEAGVLDLGDISYDTATQWLASWRTLLFGADALKVPILYEHTTPAKFIPFGRSPVEIAYTQATLRYMQVVAAGYGLTLADIGIVEGESGTLAGAIRSERRSLRTGVGIARRKMTAYWCRMLPKYLRWEVVERDDEALVAKGRARLANSMALRNLVGKDPILKAGDALEQLVSDGLITVTVTLPESVPEPPVTDILQPTHVVAGQLQKPVAPSQGGAGEVKPPPGAAKSLVERAEEFATEFNRELARAVIEAGGEPITDDPTVTITDEGVLLDLALLETKYAGGVDPSDEFLNELEQIIVSKAAPEVGQLPTSLWKGA